MNPAPTKHHARSRLNQAALELDKKTWTNILHLFVLSGFAVAQPLYDLFAQYTDFFLAHDARPRDILSLTLLFSIALPLLLASVELLAGLISRYARIFIHQALVGGLVMLFALPIAKKLHLLPDASVIALAALAATAFVWAYLLSASLRGILTWLAATIFVFPIYFLALSPARELVFRESQPVNVTQPPDSQIPIVFVIFEELPLVSLMDENHLIDPVRYPNFARLSQSAHWFRNYTVNAHNTKLSLPSMLTGRHSKRVALLTAKNHPDSLFTLLGNSGYRIVPLGYSKHLCPREYSESSFQEPTAGVLRRMSRDMFVVYLHMILPPGLSSTLPPVTDNWNNFLSSEPGGEAAASDIAPKAKTNRRGVKGQAFDLFIDALEVAQTPTLYYMHSLLLHNPWLSYPSGRRTGSSGKMPGYRRGKRRVDLARGFGGKRWSHNEWLVVQGYQRHLLELGAADTKLGALMKRLEELGMLDDSLLVVTSDHGCSFEPGSRNRGREGTVEGDTMPVPLIIKVPQQQQGVISDDNVEAIDILPTIADALNIQLPWPVDGQSMFDLSTPKRGAKTMTYTSRNRGLKRLVVSATNEVKYDRLRNKLAIFGSGTTKPNGLFSFGLYGHLVDRKLADVAVVADRGERLTVHVKSRRGYILGRVLNGGSPETPTHLAISVNGKVRAVTQTYQEPPSKAELFNALLPEEAWRNAVNKIDVFVISDMSSDGDGQVQLSSVIQKNN